MTIQGYRISNMSKLWTGFIMVVFLLLSFIPIAEGSNGHQENGIPISSGETPVLWTHHGPVKIQDLSGNIFALPGDTDTDFIIVQFDGPVGKDEVRALEQASAPVLEYFPDNAYVVKWEYDDKGPLEDLDRVIGISPFLSGLKVSEYLYDDIEKGWYPDDVFTRITVEAFMDDNEIGKSLVRRGMEFERVSQTRYHIPLPVPDPVSLISIDGIEWVEPRSDPVLLNDKASEIINVEEIWDDMGLDGTGQTVAVTDSGLDTGVDDPLTNGDMHADLDNRVTLTNWAGSSPDDENGHGTHVTGSVAGDGSSSGGSIKGMAPNASVFFQGIENDAGSLQTPGNLSLLFKQSYENGARVHTNSWGYDAFYGQYNSDAYDVDWSMHHYGDMLILYSAGNSGKDSSPGDGKVDLDSIGPPATAKSIISVGASENLRFSGGLTGTWLQHFGYTNNPIRNDRVSNNSRGLAPFSSRGPTDDDRIKPDLVAPGTNILSLRSSVGSSTGWGTHPNTAYLYMGGTSMATPITAGTAVLVRQYYNDTYEISPSSALMKATLINGALDLTPGQYGGGNPTTKEVTRRPDMAQGWGRVDLKNSLNPYSGSLSFMDQKEGLSTGDNITRVFYVRSSEELRMTLAWTDYPGSLFAGKQLINDLDLVLTAPDGTEYNGNDLTYPYDDSQDRINPVEGICVRDPMVGWWKVEINAYNIPRGPQPFALVSSGNITEMIVDSLIMDRAYYSTDDDIIRLTLTGRSLSGMGSVNVNISSTSEPLGKKVTLLEEGDFGSFTGSIRTINRTGFPEKLLVADGDSIRAWFEDISSGFLYEDNSIAKRPVNIDLVKLPENHLTYSWLDTLELKGVGDPGLDAYWTLPGSGLGWQRLYDDGHVTQGDEIAGDGIYSALFFIDGDIRVWDNISVRIKDPYLGFIEYEQFRIAINTSLPRVPQNLRSYPLAEGNSVILTWDDMQDSKVETHWIYVNSTTGPPSLDISDWTFFKDTENDDNLSKVEGLIDGVEYHFRVAGVDELGYFSSPSLPTNATPSDSKAPDVSISGSPFILSKNVQIEFDGDDDISRVELQYYNDTNGNGSADDGGEFIPAANGTGTTVLWDTEDIEGIEDLIMRYRAYDEVPNISPWKEVTGYSIDNIGPTYVRLETMLPEYTNVSDHRLMGETERWGSVVVVLNNETISEAPVGTTGIFQIDIELSEGRNSLKLLAYDKNGAGPTEVTYVSILDTKAPTAEIGGINETVEIGSDGVMAVSLSGDPGFEDPETGISSLSWTISGPTGLPQYGSGVSIVPDIGSLGPHLISLEIKDLAGNRNSTTLQFEVIDTISPSVLINGERTVNEDTTALFDTSGTTDNYPGILSSYLSTFNWTVSGPGGSRTVSERNSTSILFPHPGEYFVNLSVTDPGGNTGYASIPISVLDITSPIGEISGPGRLKMGEIGEYVADFRDNSDNGNITFKWSVLFIDGDPIEVGVGHGPMFLHEFNISGNYSIRVTVEDDSGNSRTVKKHLYVAEIEEIVLQEDKEDKEENGYLWAIIAVILVVLLVLLIAFLVLRAVKKEKVDDVDWEVEDDMDLDELDEIDDEEEEVFFDMEDDDEEEWEW